MPSSDMDERRRSARKRHARPSAHSAALESLRAAREGRESRTDQVIDDDDDGVYDEVTEEEYQELVRKRQQADDFVVDDDGLGYADDGEEFIDRVEEDEAKARGGKFGAASRKGVNGKMNADTLRRKARKLNQLEDEAPQAAGIKKFLQTGGASTVGPASLARAKLGGLKGSGASLNLDDMLSDLTSNPLADLAPGSGGGSASAKRKKQRSMLSPETVRSSRGYSLGSNLGSASGARGRNHAGGSSGARRSSNSSAAWTVRDYEEDEPGTGGDEVSMEAAMPMDDDGERDRAVEPHASAPSPPRRAPKFDEGDDEDAMVVQDGAGDGAASEGRGHSSAGNGAASRTKELLPGSGQGTASEIAASRYASAGVEPAGHAPPDCAVKESEAAGGAKPRSRFERMKEANTISVTAAAEAVLRPKQERAADELDTADAGGDAREGARKADNPGGGYMPSLDFQGPQYSLSETPSTPAGALPSTSSWLRKDKAGEYLQMFWFDATEENGTIYLMGKVVVSAQGGGEGATAFLSACVAVHGIERELFVLPRLTTDRGETGGDDTGEKAKGSSEGDGAERMDMSSVYAEMHKALVPKVIPRNARGETFGGKAVKRKYAFGDVAVPREETQYLKIKYPARYPSLSEDVCEAGGETFQTIFGARTPLIESFLIKRKLMGPCWLTVRNPKVNDGPVSWCKVEVAVQSPKAITRLTPEDMDTSGNGNVGDGNAGISKPAPSGGAGKLPPPPPVVTMSLSMKTVVSPRTHTHEVVALSALIHREVRLDGPSSDEGSKMSAWIAIRPLGLSAGDEFPKVFPHDIKTEAKAAEASARRAGKGAAPIQTMPNERALLSLFFQKLQQEDPDVLVAHNLMGFDFDILLSRAVALKLATWSKIGRLRRNKPPRAYSSGHGMKGSGSSFNANIASGRLLCDTYLSAKEFLRETTYSLTHLAGTQLKAFRSGVDPGDVPRFFGSSADIVRLALHTVNDACLVQRLMFKLQIIPLSCQLTSLSGNLWCRTMRGGRAERIEYLLLHEFHQRKFITPEKVAYGANKDGAGGGTKKAKGKKGSSGGVGAKEVGDDDGADENAVAEGNTNGTSNSSGARRKKAAYAGGLVLEPKKGLYDEYILLLDFNSLYPSLIQEYNLCFTTMDWAKCDVSGESRGGVKVEAEAEDDDPTDLNGGPRLPALPEDGLEMGVLPRVIRTLVERRAVVKKMLKKEKDPSRKQELDIRQKALKLTANSMYGCLGFSFSRFYAKPIAALVTAQGRESLQRTVDLAETQLGLEVIYGDTDSVMINTHSTDLKQVKDIGNQVKREVNKLYRSLELDLDGVFKSMLLLKKKKYAALIVVEGPDGSITYEKEMKGLDLVRREWCVLSKDTGKFVLDRILSGEAREAVVAGVHEHLEALAKSMRAGEIEVSKYVITKGLNKAPHEYPDAKSQPHVQVALAMQKAGKSVNVGHHIPYVMCKIPGVTSPAERARHPDDVLRGEGKLEVDVEWYLSQQIVPPISRLCEPIEGTSLAILAEKMGLDASKFTSHTAGDPGAEQEDWAFTPTSQLPDSERFRGVDKLKMKCRACGQEADFPGVFLWDKRKPVTGPGDLQIGTVCPNKDCGADFWGVGSEAAWVSILCQRLTLAVRRHLQQYYDTSLRCDDSSCGLRTRSAGVMGVACPGRGCQGRLVREYTDKALYEQLKFYESLFDVDRAQRKLSEQFNLEKGDVVVSAQNRGILSLVGRRIQADVQSSGYNWIRPSLWSSVFTSRVASKK